MDSSSQSPSEVSQSPSESSEVGSPAPATFEVDKSASLLPSFLSSSGISSWDKNLKLRRSLSATQGSSQTEKSGMASLARITSGIGIPFPPTAPGNHDVGEGSSGEHAQSNVLESFTKGLLDSSKGAVKAVQTKARHMVSQKKRRYQDKYKVYNLCSERLYDASLFKGKVLFAVIVRVMAPGFRMGFQKEEYDEVSEYSEYMLLVEAAEREEQEIQSNSSASTWAAGKENKQKDVVAAGNSMVVDPCPWWSKVPRKKRTPRIPCSIKAERESTPQMNVAPIMPYRHPPLPEWMDTLIRGYWGMGLVLVLQKQLKKSDIDGGQSRFSIPQRQILNTFLIEKEREDLDRNGRISVTLIQPCRETCFVELRKWNLAKSFSYVLAKTWNNVAKNPRNELSEGVEVQLWAFRVMDSLNFAMVRVEKSREEDRK